MMPARCLAELKPEPVRAARRGLAIIATALGLAGAGALGWWLPDGRGLAVLGGLGLVSLLRLLISRPRGVRLPGQTQLNPPPAASNQVPLRLPARPWRQPAGEIRCNPFFELLSASSL